jgi:Spy/CpxP family protein refolding chaperone
MKRLLPACLSLVAALAFAQHHGYTGHQTREIKALSPEEIKQYRDGAGMGFALPAELNSYPGPMHALELADQLKLTGPQRAGIRALMDRHKAEARAIGARLVEAEQELDALFRSGTVGAGALKMKVEAAGALRAEYRLSHLDTHRQTRALLTREQIVLYDRLRGYAQDAHKPLR